MAVRRRRRKIKRRFGAPKISQQILHIGLYVLGLMIVIYLGILAGQNFGSKVVTYDTAMEPAILADEAVRVNKAAYILFKPRRFDVIVFDMGKNHTNRYYIRRVVALPGETVQIIGGILYVNDEPLDYPYNSTAIMDAGRVGEPVTLGIDEYFVLGDNYNNCDDSRFNSIGNISKKQIVGKAK